MSELRCPNPACRGPAYPGARGEETFGNVTLRYYRCTGRHCIGSFITWQEGRGPERAAGLDRLRSLESRYHDRIYGPPVDPVADALNGKHPRKSDLPAIRKLFEQALRDGVEPYGALQADAKAQGFKTFADYCDYYGILPGSFDRYKNVPRRSSGRMGSGAVPSWLGAEPDGGRDVNMKPEKMAKGLAGIDPATGLPTTAYGQKGGAPVIDKSWGESGATIRWWRSTDDDAS